MELLKLILVAFSLPCIFIKGDSFELEAPENLTLHELKDKNAHISWEPVSKEALLDCYSRYLVKIWSEDGNDTFLIAPDITTTDIPYYPGVTNNVTVSLSTCNAVGPPSNVVTFDAPHEEPTKPEFLNLHQLGNDSVLVTWYQPRIRTGKLLGYHLFYGSASKAFSLENAYHYEITDIDKEQAKIWDLCEDSTYRVGVYSFNIAGDSKTNYNEVRLTQHTPIKPGKPTFTWKVNYTAPDLSQYHAKKAKSRTTYSTIPPLEYYLKISTTTAKPRSDAIILVADSNSEESSEEDEDCITNLVIIWHPNLDSNPGHYFSVKIRENGEEDFGGEYTQYSEDYVLLTEYNACKAHEVVVTSIDGEYETESDVQEIPVIVNK